MINNKDQRQKYILPIDKSDEDDYDSDNSSDSDNDDDHDENKRTEFKGKSN